MDRNFGDRRKRSDATGRRLKRWLSSIALLVTMGLIIVPVLLAVHDEAFQLDGDVSAATNITSLGGRSQTVDWDTLFNTDGTTRAQLPAGFSHARLDADFGINTNGSFNTLDGTTFTTGSKDTLSITPGWQCTISNNVNSKVDLMNVYAADYTDPVTQNRFLYFGLERNVNTGDANIGFWFLQGDANCVSAGGTVAWTGHHQDGDILIVSAFTKGGSVPGITAYKWSCAGATTGAQCDATGFLDLTPVAGSGDCRDPLHPINDPICAVSNTAPITTPWTTVKKTTVDNALDTGEFFEGGINLTQTGFGDKCFNTFIGDTRSSQSPTATIFDYARGSLGECASTTVTTPSITGPNGTIGSQQIPTNAQITVYDTANITVSGILSYTGQVNFFLCGPFTSQTLCNNDSSVPGSAGVPAGSKTVTANGNIQSDNMTVTEVGWYCWRAEFTATSPDGIPGSSDSSSSECFQITPVTATLVTHAGTTPVNFGSAVTDTADLSGTAFHQGTSVATGHGTDGSINPQSGPTAAGGTITFYLYGPSTSGCGSLATGFPTTGIVVNVSGDNTYGGASSTPPVSFTPQTPGTYHWKASYSGDSPNTVGNSDNNSCNQSREDVVVQQIPTGIQTKQGWFPQDTANISAKTGNLVAGGTVTFSLYNNGTCDSTNNGLLYTSGALSVPGGSQTAEVSTSNTTFSITTSYTDAASSLKGPYSWKVVYTPAAGDTAHTGSQSACDVEHFGITYTNDKGPSGFFGNP